MDFSKLRLVADTIRVLSAEAIQKAKSGHPGMPLGCADVASVLWFRYLRHNPADPQWFGRDRFVLSAGHGSMLLYSLLHLFGYGLTMDDIKNFRQLNSLTPGHPEFGHTAGVDITTGPLGSGIGSAVGMAMAEKQFAARTGMDQSGIQQSRIFTICGDGCMQEGNSSEAASIAGHLKLDNIILLYDSNSISIEGGTDLAFTENVAARFEAFGWRTMQIDNANNMEEVDKVLAKAVIPDGRPTLVVCKTTIGFGAPNKAGKASSHGEPLGEEEVAALKNALNWKEEPFTVPAAVKEFAAQRRAELVAEAEKWNNEFSAFAENSGKKVLIKALIEKPLPADLLQQLLAVVSADKPAATRASSGKILQKLSELIPSLTGGSADLGPSNKTIIAAESSFASCNYSGRNLHFGIRELEMGMAANGMALFGTAIPYTATFTVFSDYMKPAIRLACLQKLREFYIFTHDSFYVGEDGPTHEPVEHLTMLRTIPDMRVFRPAEGHEAAHCWVSALKRQGPTAMILTRQDVRTFTEDQAKKIDVSKGAYILSDDADFDVILTATGSEVCLALDAAENLRAAGKKVRVISMPSMELFLQQDASFKEALYPASCEKRVSIEAGSTALWYQIIGLKGLAIGLDHFGASAPYKVLAKEFGFTPESVTEKVLAYLK